MRAWRLSPMRFGTLPDPSPGPGELLLRVLACGVCRTDLHLLDGDLPPRHPGVVPGHEVVGEVTAVGPRAEGYAPGDRVGAAWLRSTCGTCRYCLRGAENLCRASLYTGWDADGGYAEMCLVPAAFAHSLPSSWDDVRLAPLLCAGIIGYRALKLAEVPPGGRLGIWGFGGSAHLAAQVAMAQGASVHVVTRSARARELAVSLGAETATETAEGLPPLDSGIVFAPAGTLVPAALQALDLGGTLAIAGIHLTDVPALSYRRDLYGERRLLSVTSNTRRDAAEFLTLAERLDLHVETDPRPLAEADRALSDLAEGKVRGAAVVLP